jgi:hypothetical protein
VEAPPAVVVDAHDVCPDMDRAQEALREALGGSVAPQGGWRLRVFDERRGTHFIVTANLDDAQGNGVAHRVIDATASDRCDGVISALGVWAALVLDAEAAKARAHQHQKGGGAKPPAGAPRGTGAAPSSVSGSSPASDSSSGSASDSSSVAINVDAGAPAPARRGLEIGASGTLENSPLTTTDSALVGGDVYMLVEMIQSFFLRPSLAVAASIASPADYYSTRVDACLQVPGNYLEHRGLLLETCAGIELGALDHDQGLPTHATDMLFSVGPTIGLRGDLASDLSVEVRGLAGFNVAHSGDAIQLLSMRAELGLTWRLR